MSAICELSLSDSMRRGTEELRRFKRSQTHPIDWFYVQKIRAEAIEETRSMEDDAALRAAEILCRVVERMPLHLRPGAWIAGDQDGAFSPSYALINPSFKVESFGGFFDPTAIYDDIDPKVPGAPSSEEIESLREFWAKSDYVRELKSVYSNFEKDTSEVVFFMESVTGHTIPDLRPFIRDGIAHWQALAREHKGNYSTAMCRSLDAVLILAERYHVLAQEQAAKATTKEERQRFLSMAEILRRVPKRGAQNIREAVQVFALLWQAMVLEQAPNPYAFSVGNLDRILEPYYPENADDETRAVAVESVRQLLCFFQVGSRCWAISQNILVGGRSVDGRDLSGEMTDIVLDAFYETNDPQPALSVKVHSDTPKELSEKLGRFFFTPGHSTPSLFNDDSLFELLRSQGIAEEDLPDAAVAGCQEPLIMGRSSINTTNTWLNLAKILELACNDGCSFLSGKKLGPSWAELGFSGIKEAYENLEDVFLSMLDFFLPRMQDAGNACTSALGRHLPVPLTSSFMDSFSTWRDMRDPQNPGVRYSGSGCLVHGLSVVADSLLSVRKALASQLADAEPLRAALKEDWNGFEDLRKTMTRQNCYGNNSDEADKVAAGLAEKVSLRIGNLRNEAGKPFLADWSTPSTHLLYGYWVGATPDGRHAREMLGYGIDPRPESDRSDLYEKMLSVRKLPFKLMTGGYASHIGLSDRWKGLSMEEKGEKFFAEIVKPLFSFKEDGLAPYYVYFNVDEVDHLKRVLADPKKYAPDGIYIMRIHGTFVNFLDLSPAIQKDIMDRLETGSRGQ